MSSKTQTTKTPTQLAIAALTGSKNGITSTALRDKTGWAALPTSTYLRALAGRHGYKHSAKPGDDGLLRHSFAPLKAAAASSKPAKKTPAKKTSAKKPSANSDSVSAAV